MRTFYYLTYFILLIACHQEKETGFTVITVDVKQDHPVALSEIADEIKTIDLELTDQSMIGKLYFGERVLLMEDYIVIKDGLHMVYLFDCNGKFIRTIGSKGQGPGEYTHVSDIAVDERNQFIYIAGDQKILQYHFNGCFISEQTVPGNIEYLVHDENLIAVLGYFGLEEDKDGYTNSKSLYIFDNKMHLQDSISVRNYKVDVKVSIGSLTKDYITILNNQKYLFYPSDLISKKEWIHYIGLVVRSFNLFYR